MTVTGTSDIIIIIVVVVVDGKRKMECTKDHHSTNHKNTYLGLVVAIVAGWNKYRYDRIHDSTMSLIIVPVFVLGRKDSNLLQLLSTHFSNPTKLEIAALAEHPNMYLVLVFSVHLIIYITHTFDPI